MKKPLIIDVPSYITDEYENVEHFVQEIVFKFIDSRPTRYLKDYTILYNNYSSGKRYIKELIDDWDLDYFSSGHVKDNPSNSDKVNAVKEIVKRGSGGDALIFFDYNKKEKDLSNKIVLDQITNDWSIHLKVCRLEYGGKIS